MRATLEAQPNLSIVIGEVVDLTISNGSVTGVRLADGGEIQARAVVLTSGTFLRGVIHLGSERHPAGRIGERASWPWRIASRLPVPAGSAEDWNAPTPRRAHHRFRIARGAER